MEVCSVILLADFYSIHMCGVTMVMSIMCFYVLSMLGCPWIMYGCTRVCVYVAGISACL